MPPRTWTAPRAEAARETSASRLASTSRSTTTDLLAESAVTLARALFASDLPPPSLKSQVPDIAPRAVFFVYGEKGQGGTEAEPNRGFYEVARQPKRIWEVPDGQHIAGITTEPEEYERQLIAFFARTLLQPTPNGRSTP